MAEPVRPPAGPAHLPDDGALDAGPAQTAVPAQAPRAARDILGQLVARGGNVGLGIVVTVVLVGALGPAEFGQWSTILSVVGIGAYIADLGLEQVAVRRASGDRGREASWIGALLLTRLGLGLLAAVLSIVVLLVIADGATMRLAAVIIGSSTALNAFSSLRAIFQVRVRNDVPAWLEVVNGLLWGGAVLVLAFLDRGLVAFSIAFVVAAAVVTALQAWLALRVPGASVDLRRGVRHCRELLRVGLPVSLAGLLILSFAKIDQAMVFEINGEAAAGQYGLANRILDSARMVPVTVMATLLPLLGAAWPTDPERAKRLLQTAIELMLVVSLPLAAFMVTGAETFVRDLFGPEFLPAVTSIQVLCGTFVIVCLGFLAGYGVIVLDIAPAMVRYAGLGLVFNVVGNLLFLPRYGFEAAAWTTLGTEILVVGLALRRVTSGFGLARPAMRRIVAILVAGVGMALSVLGLEALGLGLWATLPVSGAAYLLLIVVLGGVDVGVVRGLLRKQPV